LLIIEQQKDDFMCIFAGELGNNDQQDDDFMCIFAGKIK
jgi:hypothetical protein